MEELKWKLKRNEKKKCDNSPVQSRKCIEIYTRNNELRDRKGGINVDLKRRNVDPLASENFGHQLRILYEVFWSLPL